MLENNLLDKLGWKHFKQLASHEQKRIYMLFKAHQVSICHNVIYKYGYQILHTPQEAIELDKKWQYQAAGLNGFRTLQLCEYQAFQVIGRGAKASPDYKCKCCHFVFDAKHDGRHETC